MSESAEERLKSAEELLDRLERTRAKLEETKDPDEAIEILSELSEIAKEVEAQLAAGQAGGGIVTARLTSCARSSSRTSPTSR